MRTLTKELINKVGESIELVGWVYTRRDHGKLIFIDLRDRWGMVQIVFTPARKELLQEANALRSEWVVSITGTARERPKGMENALVINGNLEIEATDLKIINEALTLPFPIDTEGTEIEEELRLKYRYLDLRRPRMRDNILLRHKAVSIAKDYLNRNDFIEIETPLLTKTSPEGARDFLVPSRVYPGNFYALPQSPQQYKQLLMIAGFERYYQIARCPRDEDQRGDRQPEHTQIDLEMSFVTEKDIRSLTEELMIEIAEGCEKKIFQKPFPIFTHEEAMKKFNSDKFDLRSEPRDKDTLAFAWVTDFPLLEWDKEEKRYTFAHNPFSAPKPEHLEKLMKREGLETLRAQQYDLVCNGYELASGGVRISNPEVQRQIFKIMGLSDEMIDERFGHILEAYKYGAPPHAGIAPGLDRLVMLLAGETVISEVIAFPKTGRGRDPMMGSPSPATEKQLKELGLQIKR